MVNPIVIRIRNSRVARFLLSNPIDVWARPSLVVVAGDDVRYWPIIAGAERS